MNPAPQWYNVWGDGSSSLRYTRELPRGKKKSSNRVEVVNPGGFAEQNPVVVGGCTTAKQVPARCWHVFALCTPR